MLPVPFIIYCDMERSTAEFECPAQKEEKHSGINAYE
jgi:hypothetical protein